MRIQAAGHGTHSTTAYSIIYFRYIYMKEETTLETLSLCPIVQCQWYFGLEIY